LKWKNDFGLSRWAKGHGSLQREERRSKKEKEMGYQVQKLSDMEPQAKEYRWPLETEK
jgi:hypothetical protein